MKLFNNLPVFYLNNLILQRILDKIGHIRQFSGTSFINITNIVIHSSQQNVVNYLAFRISLNGHSFCAA